MTARTRLLLTLLSTALLLVVPALYGVGRLAELRDIAFELHGRHAAAFLELGRLRAALARLDRFQSGYVAISDPVLLAGTGEALEEAREQLTALERDGYQDAARQAHGRLDALEQATREIQNLVETARMEEATQLLERIRPLLRQMESSLDVIAREIDRRSNANVVEAERISSTAATTALVALLAALAAALMLGLTTTRALTSPLGRLRSAMATVAAGDFVAPDRLPYGRHDEIGDLARSFRSMTQRLAELDRLKAEFVGMASHELRTPINIISGYAGLMEEELYGKMDHQQREVVSLILEQTRVLTRLVNQLLDMSRIEAGVLHIQPEPVELEPLLQRTRRDFAALARLQHIEFDLLIDDSAPATITADPEALRTGVLGNLLSNAFKFTPENGRIGIHVRGDDERVAIVVTDTGPGIPADQLPFIFDKYFQVGHDTRVGGTGLGLAIARQIVHAHAGTIDVQSSVGHGTSFTVSLPIRPATNAPPGTTSNALTAQPHNLADDAAPATPPVAATRRR